MMKYSYYPGCSLEKNALSYHNSAMAVAEELDIELEEVPDWNCCGATEYMSIDLIASYALVGRNLALAGAQGVNGNRLIAPCSACFLNLSKVNRAMADSPVLADKVNVALGAGGLHYEPDTVETHHLLDVLVDDVGLPEIKEHVKKPLYGLRVAPYYGCLVVRPGYGGQFDDPEYPTSLDKLLESLGAEVIDFPLKTHCCGGHMTQISEEVALDLIHRLLSSAAEYDADILATVCPMCQLNLDGYQSYVDDRFGTDFNISTLYFTQLMGLAFGLDPQRLGFGSEFIDAAPALGRITDEPPSRPKKRRTNGKELPNPGSRGGTR